MQEEIERRVSPQVPSAIWIPDSGKVSIYRGSPLEMVCQMAMEMADDEGTPDTFEAVDMILESLANNRDIYVNVDLDGISDENVMALTLIQILLGVGIAKPMAKA
jgi:hypothetical protein